MKLNYRITAIALTAAIGIAVNAGAQHGAQGHDTRAPADNWRDAKQTMAPMADAEFVEMMTEHHQGAIYMAKLEESRGTRDAVKALAARMREAQEREVKEMGAGHADHANTPQTGAAPDTRGTPGQEGQGAMMQKQREMMQQQAMASNKRIVDASGAGVDQAFLEEMTKHHKMALEMISKTKFKDASLQRLAHKMAADQKRELGEFKKLRTR